MIHYKATVTCVGCAKQLTLGFWDMLPNPRHAKLIICCGKCGHGNTVPYFYSFFGFVLAILLTITLPLLAIPLHIGLTTIALIGLSIISYFASFYLVFRCYFSLFKAPFHAKNHQSWLSKVIKHLPKRKRPRRF